VIDPSNGELTPTGQNPPAAHQSPTRVASDKYGYRLYAINATSNDLNAYFIDRRNGYLYATPGSPFLIGAKPEDLRVHPSGRFVYITAQKNLIYAFAVEPDGSLMMVPGSPFSTQMDPRGLAITPDGRYLYVSNYSPGLIDAFSINEVDGALTPVPGSPYTPQPVGASVARPELSRSHRTQLANS
jgi:6-phosphogluconolactonase (cycloisomerase 2 family)